MLALTLMVGIVIDDAIVVLENIFRFIEEKGVPPFQAAIEGTKEIGLAVMATTLSLLAVFLPVGFMGGIVGRFMSSFGLTVVVCDRGVVAGVVHADADAGGAFDQAQRRRQRNAAREAHRTRRSRFKGIAFLSSDRSHVHEDVDVVHGASLGDRTGLRGRDCQHRSALHVRRKELSAG